MVRLITKKHIRELRKLAEDESALSKCPLNRLFGVTLGMHTLLGPDPHPVITLHAEPRDKTQAS